MRSTVQSQTIDDVIRQLDGIIERCHDRGSRLGYFPAMYRKTTAEVKKGIETGRFEDPARMERLDVVFAERYLRAFEQFERGERPTAAWDYAFSLETSEDPTVIQHLLLGMNAHINLDLGISAAQIAPGPSLDSLKRDFDEINTILGELVDRVQDDLASVFPLLGLLDFVCLRFDEFAVHRAIVQARSEAWDRAVSIARCGSDTERSTWIEQFDRQTVRLSRSICPPPETMTAAAKRENIREARTVRRVIEALVD
jgi:hypothetical protein